MASSPQPEAWMRPALAWLFDSGDDVLMRQALQDHRSLAELRSLLENSIAAIIDSPIPKGDRGDNLLLALITLRLKFSRPEAAAKLEKNLSLRQSS